MTFDRPITVALKRLSAVDVDPDRSHQHEINGVGALRAMLGTDRREFVDVPWARLTDEGDHDYDLRRITWYDSRERHETRTEWRLYYSGEMNGAVDDTLCVIRVEQPEQLAILVLPAGSSWESQFIKLIGHPGEAGQARTFNQTAPSNGAVVVLEQVLDILGWVVPAASDPVLTLDAIEARFGRTFPATAEFSGFVRELVGNGASLDDSLWNWMRAEEAAFRLLERSLVQERLDLGFANVDEFVTYSLSVQNRRKSRAGHALEHHLATLFEQTGLRFVRGANTEGKRKPDFLFPGIAEYRDAAFPTDLLASLAAKTTCKDRWRQVLSEAARIPRKHLCTLEPAISADQLTEMNDGGVRLVVPEAIRDTFAHASDEQVVTVSEFVTAMLRLQANT